MAPKNVIKRKVEAIATAAGSKSQKSAKLTKLTVSGVLELKMQLMSKKTETIEALEIKTDLPWGNTIECFVKGLGDIRKLLPNLKSLSLDASEERDECFADVFQHIFKAWEGSNTLEFLRLNMDWAQFKGMDQALTGFSKGDCIKLKESLGSTKNIPVGTFKKKKYNLASLPGLKKLDLIMCDVERIDERDPQVYNKLKFEVMVYVLQRYLFSEMKNFEVNIKLMDESSRHGYDSDDGDYSSDENVDEESGDDEEQD